MQNKNVGFVPQVDFKEQTPEVLIKTEKPDPLYEKAFLSREDKSENGICSKYDNMGLRLELNVSKALEKREVMQITRP